MLGRSFFSKLLIAYIILVVVYTIIAVCVSFFKDGQRVRSELSQNQQHFLLQSRDKIDMKLGVSSNLIAQLKYYEHVVKFAGKERNYYEITQSSYALQNHINAFSEFGYSIDLMKTNDDLVITPQYSLDKKRYMESIEMTEEDFKQIGTESTSPTVTLSSSHDLTSTADEGGSIRIVNPEKVGAGNSLFFVVTFYEQLLLPPLSPETQEAFAIIENGRFVTLKSSFDDKRREQLIAYPLAQLDELTTGDYTKLSTDEFDFHLIRSQTMPQWSYLYVTQNYSLIDSFMPNLKGAALLLAVLVLAGLAFAYMVSRRMYRPVSHLVGLFKSYGEPAGTDEFAFLHETATSISKANEQLKSALHEHRLSMRDKFLRDLLHGLVPPDKTDYLLHTHQLQGLRGNLTVCVVAFSNMKELEEHYSKDAILTIKSQTSLILHEQLKVHFPCELLDLDFAKYVFIIVESDTDNIQKKLMKAMARIEDGHAFGLIAAVGPPADSVNEIDRSFDQALDILKRRSATDPTSVVTYEQLSSIQMVSYYYPIDSERELISYVIRGKRESAMHTLNRLLSDNLEQRQLTRQQLDQFSLLILATLNRIMQQLNMSSDEFAELHKESLEAVQHGESMERMTAIMTLFGAMVDTIDRQNEMMDNSTVKRMIDYIHENYNKDLSLSMIAEAFNFSPGYVSIAFKNHSGDNFKDYLNFYRVQQAKEMMRQQKDIKIGDLALMVGCNNANTFIRMFRKYEGLAPGQYAKKLTEKQ
ncbi:helix-turn-helix domain-containing protein [Paenibacillus sp. LHD-117]|uniref:helix-turn-helix domain-containing protein n=1 Tax=Paenibacillus sp. LHD-117 TaxID=3071412 RepID=UPI0027DEE266|nr:helix-turn-helix domain-containing protein [Paenibacillus sp. LHD-117]MDQ6421410.1 helix-turn-helix domain-containing protein [Paenibacillus sp. LHD-117]